MIVSNADAGEGAMGVEVVEGFVERSSMTAGRGAGEGDLSGREETGLREGDWEVPAEEERRECAGREEDEAEEWWW